MTISTANALVVLGCLMRYLTRYFLVPSFPILFLFPKRGIYSRVFDDDDESSEIIDCPGTFDGLSCKNTPPRVI